jgi:hypothetical protein
MQVKKLSGLLKNILENLCTASKIMNTNIASGFSSVNRG